MMPSRNGYRTLAPALRGQSSELVSRSPMWC